jgi:hypothetical protein
MSEGRIVGEIDPRTTSIADVLFRLFNVVGAGATAANLSNNVTPAS